MLVKKSDANSCNKTSSSRKRGGGFVNSAINNLPFELHIPGYRYCGPGTKLSKRLARGDQGINKLDEACKQHDIAYDKDKDLQRRHDADRILLREAKNRFQSSDASWSEKAAALGVAAAIKTKVKLGMGCKSKGTNRKNSKKGSKKNKKRGKSGKGLSFKDATRRARKVLKNKKFGNGGKELNFKDVTKRVNEALKNKKFSNASEAIKLALKVAKAAAKGKGKIRPGRIIPLPKIGGFFPFIPLFTALSAAGAVSGGVAGIVKAINDAKAASKQLKENQRHNRVMEETAMGKGLYVKPHKQGLGLFLGPPQYSKNYP